MKNITINIILVLAVILVLALFALFVRVGVVPDRVTVFRSSGIICSDCSEKIKRVLEMDKGVASSRVDAGSGHVVVWYDSCAVRPEKLARGLTGAGFASSVIATMPVARYSAMTGVVPDPAGEANGGSFPGCCRKHW